MPDELVAEADVQQAIGRRRSDRDRETHEGVTDPPAAPGERHPAVPVDGARVVAQIGADRGQGFGKGAGTGAIEAGWGGAVPGVMEASLVVGGAPRVAGGLRRRQGGEAPGGQHLRAEGAIGAFERAVGLRVEGAAMDHGDAEPQPPRRQDRQVMVGRERAPGRAVVTE